MAVLDEPAVMQHEHPIGAHRGRQPVGDGDRRAALGEVRQRPRDPHLGKRVDRRRRLVEEQDVGIGEPRPQQGDELAFSGRQLLAALADARVQPIGHRVQPVDDVEPGDDGEDRRVVGTWTGEPHVGARSCRRTGTVPGRPRRGAGGARRCRPPSRARRRARSRRRSDRRSGRSGGRGWSCRSPWRRPSRPAGRPGCGC